MDGERRCGIYTTEYYSAIKNEILPFATTWTDLESIMLSEKSLRKTNIVYYQLYVESKKLMNITKKKQSTDVQDKKTSDY